MNAETIFEVVKKLTGEVTPVADTAIDNIRYENMAKFIEVFDMMHTVIDDVATRYKDSPFASEKSIGQLAIRHLDKMGIAD